ncbi:MAG: MFS transporter [Bacteroidales bacterium]|nr:MFS transporter [Bacteroidales bacterium]
MPKLRLLYFLQFAAWGAYLPSMGRFLSSHMLAGSIGLFFSSIGLVSLIMPALMGMVADRWIQAQRLYGICQIICAIAMASLGLYTETFGGGDTAKIYFLYLTAIMFYMPSLSLCNSVSYNALEKSGMDPIATFPKIRPLGTVGFVASMWIVDLLGYQTSGMQFLLSGLISLSAGLYGLSLPKCEISPNTDNRTFAERLGLKALSLFKRREMAVFFIFAALMGVCTKISDGFANTYVSSFGAMEEFADTFGVRHANILISLSQISEAVCILLIPIAFRKFGFKNVVIIAMVAWGLRFALFGLGNPGSGVWMLILSCLIYGVAFNFFSISGSLFVNKECEPGIRSSAQGLYMMMSSGIGSIFGMMGAQAVVSHFVNLRETPLETWEGWQTSWLIFAAYALAVGLLFALMFRKK